MKSIKTTIMAAVVLLWGAMALSFDAGAQKKYRTYGVMFYNLENLFDTINNNGKYDLEFSPAEAANGTVTSTGQKSTSSVTPSHSSRPRPLPRVRLVSA